MSWHKAHEHFCAQCFGKPGKKFGGWWRCIDKKCVKVPQTLCKKHDNQSKDQKARSNHGR